MKQTIYLATVLFLFANSFSVAISEIVLQSGFFDGNTYHLVANENSERIHWKESEAFAVSLGGHLVTVNSAAENDFLLSTFAEAAQEAKSTAHSTGGLLSMWIGYRDLASEGNFDWVGGGGTGYTNWLTGQPQGSEADEDFAALLATSDFGPAGKWHDVFGNFRGDDVTYGIVEVVGVPEPSALLITILAGIAFSARRRKS